MKKTTPLSRPLDCLPSDRLVDLVGQLPFSAMSDSPTHYLLPHRSFPKTRWSIVAAACGNLRSDEDLESLQAICSSYWYPLYAWARQAGWQEEDARDLIQSFFERMLEKGFLAAADPQKGKLRTFLLTCLKRHAKDLRAKNWAACRDARQTLSLDFEWAEGRYSGQASHELNPEAVFDRRWAYTLLHYSLDLLAREMAEAGKAETFETLKPCLGFQAEAKPHEELAKELGISRSALKSQIFRLRKRFHDLLLEQVSLTLGEGENPKDELAALMLAV